jgi:hypothetical protein
MLNRAQGGNRRAWRTKSEDVILGMAVVMLVSWGVEMNPGPLLDTVKTDCSLAFTKNIDMEVRRSKSFPYQTEKKRRAQSF